MFFLTFIPFRRFLTLSGKLALAATPLSRTFSQALRSFSSNLISTPPISSLRLLSFSASSASPLRLLVNSNQSEKLQTTIVRPIITNPIADCFLINGGRDCASSSPEQWRLINESSRITDGSFKAVNKLQKVYRSYPTWRKLADSAVVVEELCFVSVIGDPHYLVGFSLIQPPRTPPSSNKSNLGAEEVSAVQCVENAELSKGVKMT
ncbi:hypothetical protein FCM35_KLT06732 [Carex littledalei]|uniref:Uncharacterized protein n=1 Tax=Carex littledalei TaxID=544730 RepID=A0A833QUG1_9POAL|nr:hypothetical protein FCM35_KLT06732 [Carex littledalei]